MKHRAWSSRYNVLEGSERRKVKVEVDFVGSMRALWVHVGRPRRSHFFMWGLLCWNSLYRAPARAMMPLALCMHGTLVTMYFLSPSLGTRWKNGLKGPRRV